MVKEIRGRSGAGSASAHGLAPQNLSPDKHVDVCVDSDEDRGSTPLASSLRSQRSKSEGLPRRSKTEAGLHAMTRFSAARLRLCRPAFFLHDRLVNRVV